MNKKILFASCSVPALALVLAAASAQAQTSDQGVETVVVTGVQASVAGALELKQNSGQMIDSIVAEDIGKLPDSTVVESLQHVTGISIIRNSVEPSTVLIRGLPDIGTLVNGREIFTSTGRALSLPDIPSELLASVNVNKTSVATDIEGGIAGVIDVRLHRPFDFPGEEFAVSGQAVTESLAQHIDPNASALISNRWNTDLGEIGLMADISYKDTHTRSDQIVEQTAQLSNVIGPVPGAASGTPAPLCTTACKTEPAGGVVSVNVNNAAGVAAGYAAMTPNTTLYEDLGGIQRGSLVLSAQWKPSNNVQVFAEGFYTRQRSQSPVMVNVLQQYICPDPAKDTVYPGTNIVATSVSSCYSLTSDQDRHSREDTVQLSSGVDWAVTNNWELTSEIDTTLSKQETASIILDDTYNYGTDALTTINNYNGTGAHYTTEVGNTQLNPAGEYVDQLFDSLSISKGYEWDWRIDSTYNFAQDSFVKDVVVGFRITARGANNNGYGISSLNCISNPVTSNFYNPYTEGANGLTLSTTGATAGTYVAGTPSAACTSPTTGYDTQGSGVAPGAPAYTAATTLQTKAQYYTTVGGLSLAALAPNNAAAQQTSGVWFGGKYGITGWDNVSPVWAFNNIPALRTAFGYGNVSAASITQGPALNPASLFIVLETSKSGYFKTDYGFSLFGFPIDGNVGLRFTDYTLTEQANNSVVSAGVLSFVPTVASHETSILLPSWNAKVTLADNLFARFSASETETRPSFSQLNPATNYTVPGATIQGTASSGNPGLTSEKSINQDADVEYYWGKADHVSAAIFHRYVEGYIQTQNNGQITIGGATYNVSQPVNFQNAYIDGGEVAYSQFFDFLPGFWSGFGFDANGTYINGVFNNITKYHYNFAGIYEYGPVSARVSYTWSSSYKTAPTLSSGVGPVTSAWAAQRANLDASINYRYNDKLTFTLDATNLNDGKYRGYDGPNSQFGLAYDVTSYERFDETISLGVRYHD